MSGQWGGRYEIVFGERRHRAAKLAGITVIKAKVKEMDTAEAFRLAMVENLQRADLNPIEEAEGIKSLLDTGLTLSAVGAIVGKGQSYVAHKLRLLKSPEPIKALIASGALSEAHARQVFKLENLYAKARVHEFSVDGWRGLTDADLSDAECFAFMFHQMRPEDWPQVPSYPLALRMGEDVSKMLPIVSSISRTREYVLRHNGIVPQWQSPRGGGQSLLLVYPFQWQTWRA